MAHHLHHHHRVPSRRSFLLGSVGVAILAACGDDGSDAVTADGGGEVTDTIEPTTELSVVQFFGGPVLAAGGAVRAPFGLADVDGILPVDAAPAELTADVVFEGSNVAGGLVLPLHREGLPRGYYPLVFEAAEPGIYDAVLTGEGIDAPIEFAVQVSPADEVTVPGVGDPLPSVATPTEQVPRGVTPICTRQPQCPLHAASVDDALTAGRPLAVMISTPAFCKTAVCGPVLDVFLDELDSFDGVTAIHTEVYADPENDESTVAPMVEAMNLTYEPSLVLVDAEGVIVDRIDFIFDAAEIRTGLDRLVN